MKTKSVLVIDDELDFLEGLQYLLEGEGYQVRTASSAQEGIEELKKDCPSLVLLDLMMPGTKGISTLRYIRENRDVCKTPVILMSASREPQNEEFLWDAFLAKPFDIDEAIAMVSRFIDNPVS